MILELVVLFWFLINCIVGFIGVIVYKNRFDSLFPTIKDKMIALYLFMSFSLVAYLIQELKEK